MISGKAIFPPRKPSKIFFMANETLGPIIENKLPPSKHQIKLIKNNALDQFMPKTDWERLSKFPDHIKKNFTQELS